MKRNQTYEIYQKRIAAAKRYINLNLDRELELAEIAAVANFSPFHFHRIFRAFVGEPLGGYVTRLRVETAANLLVYSDLSIETIAYNVGFEAPASLNKAFRQLYDTTPSDYRARKNNYIQIQTPKMKEKIKLRAPKIVELEPKNVICVSLMGEYNSLDFEGAFAKLWAQVKARDLFTAGIEHIGVYHDDPKVTESANLRTDVCLVVHKPAQPDGDVKTGTIAGGRYAVFTHIGPYNELGPVYDAIFGEWVPSNCPCQDECVCSDDECGCGCKPGEPCQCGDDCRCVLRDEPVFEKYLNDPLKTAPEKLKTEIYIPIK